MVENQRRISELIRTIIEMGLVWKPVRPNARTAVNAFYDPVGRRLYTTFTSGLIQGERLPISRFSRIYQGPVNRILRTKKQSEYDGKIYEYTLSTVIKLETEQARLERLLECITTVKKRQWKTSKPR